MQSVKTIRTIQKTYRAYYFGLPYPMQYLAYGDEHAINTAKCHEIPGSIILKSVYAVNPKILIWSIEEYIDQHISSLKEIEKNVVNVIAVNHDIGKVLVSCAAKSLALCDDIVNREKYIRNMQEYL